MGGSTDRIEKTAEIMQSVLTIVMGIAFTTAIIAFLTVGMSTPREFEKFSWGSLFAFICVITAIVRFFHGNINYMTSTYNVPDYIAIHKKFNFRLAVDFIFLFTQAFIFCGLAVYQSLPTEFYSIFVILFFIDALWFFIIIRFVSKTKIVEVSKESKEQALINWMVTNFITATVLLLLLAGWRVDISQKVPLLFAIIMLNTIVDYRYNWNILYFPSPKKRDKATVFVGARFTTAIQDGSFDEKLRDRITAVHGVLRASGLNFFSSHLIEKFGEQKSEPEDFVERDISHIQESDLFILLLDEHFSAGVFTELGWASIMDKKIIIMVPESCKVDETLEIIEGIHMISKSKRLSHNCF